MHSPHLLARGHKSLVFTSPIPVRDRTVGDETPGLVLVEIFSVSSTWFHLALLVFVCLPAQQSDFLFKILPEVDHVDVHSHPLCASTDVDGVTDLSRASLFGLTVGASNFGPVVSQNLLRLATFLQVIFDDHMCRSPGLSLSAGWLRAWRASLQPGRDDYLQSSIRHHLHHSLSSTFPWAIMRRILCSIACPL